MKKIITLALPLLMIVSACATNVHTDYETQHNFSAYQTFQLKAHSAEDTKTYDAFGGDIFETRLHRAIKSTLNAKSLSKAKTPDFLVDYSLLTEQRIKVSNTFPYGHSLHQQYWSRGSYYGHHFDSHISDVRQLTVGTLTLKIIDAQSNKTVWSSSSQAVLRHKKSPAEAEASLQERINTMLASFPPNNVITL